MKILFIILFPLFSQAQSYVMHWNSGGHTKYIIQRSTDNSIWSTTATITAKLSDTAFTYTLPLPVKFNYYRVVADTYTGKTVQVTNISPTLIIIPSSTKIKLPSK